ncbi:MAG: hypothetical protein KUF77_13640 [Candidatus Thiodiazotropha sp. (ex Lucina aurantia)]|nr:hypothetical protein [Candidatus Thiodiazotropha sp. (ex Lucina pensylvanica)]MBT3024394.1 hypothetical protein [Candidatus Thiodiazotropha taylori]MBT3051853.1 hypothetical protein [Candidatus Thiodiazotropha sp. (ex Codakia orbicularis)]MBV2104062.1 hypothetical protein [Candidatus Thiodiazotropha sp. (ex Lucina aurantia)]MBT3032392.1 hypothetical protein [Candidatus Thiodiazotropha sp. (ex Lucina pensylvanica)]
MRNISLICLCLVILSGCSGSRPNDPPELTTDNLNLALEYAVDQSVIPAAAAFDIQAVAFRTAADTFCSTTNATELGNLQAAWNALYEKWFHLANYNFGPLNDDFVFAKYTFIDSLRVRGTNYINTVRNEIENMIAGTQALDETFFDQQTFNKVGLLALEVLSFEASGGGQSNQPDDIIGDYQNNPRKCDILTGIAQQMVKNASYVIQGWQVRHRDADDSYRTLFLDNQLDDGTNNLTQLLVAVQEHLDYLSKRNVITTSATLSGIAWNGFSEAIDEIEILLEGNTEVSFLGLMEAGGFSESVDSVRDTIAAIRSNISSRDAESLETNIGRLDGHFKREIPNGLDVELGINFSDGD